ncbi:putative sporulation protein YtxC [Paenibacillus fonticola]|uniref:putative sporulation protein YtxC n=1 Tax=Paenibacillus fonticola TaxID=379896 RepID=UPI0003651ACD|nr:putative sporulation protein YtxC [Paenibacillus fonticola]
MDFFTISAKVESSVSANQFADYMKRLAPGLHKANIKAEFVYMPRRKRMEWNMSAKTAKGLHINHYNQLMDELAQIVAEYVVDVKEPGIVGKILLKDYELADGEMQAIKSICCRFLGAEEEYAEARKARVSLVGSALRSVFGSLDALDLDGFISFRLQEYETRLRETVDFAVEEYLLDKQYEDFIGLLQYFVYFQEPLTPFIHVMHRQGGEFVLLNEGFKQIDSPASGDVVMRMADQEMQIEDVIVSTLISLSPERILLHTRDPEALAITTIRRIFGERVQLCLRCSHCKEFHQRIRQRDQVT